MASRYQIHNELTATAARASRDLKSFRDGDEVKIIAGSYVNERATVWRPGEVAGTWTVWVPSQKRLAYLDEDHMKHARR